MEYARKLPISPPTAVSTVKYQQQSLPIAQNTRILAVFLTEVLPKLCSKRCEHAVYAMAIQDEIIMAEGGEQWKILSHTLQTLTFFISSAQEPWPQEPGPCCPEHCAGDERTFLDAKDLSRQKIQMVGQKENTWQVFQQCHCIRDTILQEILDKHCSGTGAALGQQMDNRERPCCL